MAESVEVVLKESSSACESDIVKICKNYLNRNCVLPGTKITHFDSRENKTLHDEVECISIDDVVTEANMIIDYSNETVKWYVYKLDSSGPQDELCEDDTGSEVNIATHHILPSAEFFNLWESLVYENNIKERLLNYAYSMMEFSDKGVNSTVISCNRVILLHGPPGTGKTSLCKALAQKLCVRMKARYKQSVLIEVNSHSLFSKWFSESGKLVTKMFTKMKEIVAIPNTLVCLLIDEIESLAHARDQCLSGNEPSDAIKVVNTVLTQIDQIKRFPNVVILTTSNMTAAIDVAFVDRADVKQYIGPPSSNAIYKIYLSCILELIRVKIIDVDTTESIENGLLPPDVKHLREISAESLNLSGRMLRKIPFLAHALYLGEGHATIVEFLDAMRKAVRHEKEQRETMD